MKNFGGFSFTWNTGHYDGREYVEVFNAKRCKLLEFNYNHDKYEVSFFDPSDSWQSALLKTIERKDEIVVEIASAKEKEREACRIQVAQEKELAALNEEAIKLKVL
ncbi:MAG: hypothetical protein WC319_06645 [Candidatus Paceibacterota bacterium]